MEQTMTQEHNDEKTPVELDVKTESAFEFLHAVNSQHFGWDLNLDHAKSSAAQLTFDVEQESTPSGMQIVLKADGTWHAHYMTSL